MTTIIFIDLDKTIIETNALDTAVFPIICAEIATQANTSDEVILHEIYTENFQRLTQYPPSHYHAMDWDDIVNKVAKKYRVNNLPSVTKLVKQFSKPPYISLIPNTLETLARLSKQTTLALVVATNGLSKYQMPILRYWGLEKFFTDFLMPDISGYIKTAPGFYKKFTDDIYESFISVGDHYFHDVRCPIKFGFKSILKVNFFVDEFNRLPPQERPQHLVQYQHEVNGMEVENEITVLPDAVITDIGELPDVLSCLI